MGVQAHEGCEESHAPAVRPTGCCCRPHHCGCGRGELRLLQGLLKGTGRVGGGYTDEGKRRSEVRVNGRKVTVAACAWQMCYGWPAQ